VAFDGRSMSHVIVADEEARRKKQGWRGGDIRMTGTATGCGRGVAAWKKKIRDHMLTLSADSESLEEGV